MMPNNLIDIKRKSTKFAIDLNPTVINVTRKITTIEDGNKKENYLDLGNYTVRIVKSNKSKLVVNDNISQFVKYVEYFLLADWETDLQSTNEIEDSFILDNKKYIITSIVKNEEKGQITSIQAFLEVI